MSAAQESFFDQVTRYFNEAARFTSYPEGLLEQIRSCNSIYRFDFPLRQADGTIEVDPRLAGRAQPPQAADQGRHPLRARRQRRRGDGAGGADDLQVRHRRRARSAAPRAPCRSTRRSTPSEQLERITRRYTHELVKKNFIGPGHRRAGARLRHRRARDGVDCRHLYGAAPRTARRAGLRHRQAGQPGRHPRPARGDRPRTVLRPARSLLACRRHEGAGPHARPRRQARGRAGPRQRRLPRREVLPRGRRASSSPSPSTRAPSSTRTASIADAVVAHRKETGSILNFPGATNLAEHRRRARARLRHPDPGGAREPVHRRQRAARQGEDHPRRRQRPDDAGRRGDPPAARASWSSPTSTPTPAASRCRTSSG